MLGRPLAGVLGVLVAGAVVAGGVWTLVANYALGTPGNLLSPTLASGVVAAVVVLALSAVAIGAARRLRTPYW